MIALPLTFWVKWALLLIAQNFSFTFVSRARNSGSLRRHMTASIFSNGIWFASQVFTTTTLIAIISGHFGVAMALLTAVFYTVTTLVGSIAAHYLSLKGEKGKGAVGANSKYAQQIPRDDWETAQYLLHHFRDKEKVETLLSVIR